jgi:hypothetical protein
LAVTSQMKKTYVVVGMLFLSVAVLSNENDPVGARSAALGNISVPFQDVWSAAQNPAGLGFIQQPCAGIFYRNRFFLKEFSTRSAALAVPLKPGILGLSFIHSGFSLYRENKYSLSFAKAFSKSFSIGMAIYYHHTCIAEANGNFSAFSGELGLQARLRKNLLVGVKLSNPTRVKPGKAGSESMPTYLQLGISYAFSSCVSVMLETEKELTRKPRFKAGIEYEPLSGFYLRAGVNNGPDPSTFGIGFCIRDFQINLSTTYHPTLGISPQVGLTYLVNKKKKIDRDEL